MAYYYLGDKRALYVRKSGLRILLDVDDIGIINFISTDIYEPDVTFALNHFLDENSVFIDVGANLGIHALSAALKTGKLDSVIAIEPNPSLFELMSKSILINGYGNRISKHNIAAWNETTDLELCFPTDAHRVGAVKVGRDTPETPGADGQSQISFAVKGRRIDDIVPDKSRVNLVKIDVEGREPFVIEGMMETIRQSGCAIIAEFVPSEIEELYGVDRFVKMMADLGLKPHRIDWQNGALVPLTELPNGHANLVWKPS